jgi:hypothetical protein
MSLPRESWLAAAALTAALLSTGCRAPTACATPVAPVLLGSWSYKATQTGPSASLSGVLQITSQCGQELGGALSGILADASGSRSFTGTVSGIVVDTTVDLDAYLSLEDVARRHVGVVRNDSLRGQWFSLTGTGSPSGSFTSVWTSNP